MQEQVCRVPASTLHAPGCIPLYAHRVSFEGSYRILLNGGALRLVARRAFPSVIPAKLVPAKAGSGNPHLAPEAVPCAEGPHAPGFGIGTSSRAASGF
jgi:hypothetical protein